MIMYLFYRKLRTNDIKGRNSSGIGRKFHSFLNQSRNLLKPIEVHSRSPSPAAPSEEETSDDEYSNSNENEPQQNDISELSSEPIDMKMVIPKSESMTPLKAELYFLLEMENNYLKTLQSLEESRRVLSETAPYDIQKWLTQLFNKVRELLNLHTQLGELLNDCGDDIHKLCDAFICFDKEYQNYVFFIENIPSVEEILSTFSDYFKTNMPVLIDNLRKPRMRLNHYILTLESLFKKVSESEKEKLNETILIFRKYLKCADRSLLLKSIQKSPFDLTTKGDVVIHSDLRLTKGGDIQKRMYHVIFLKEEFLIVRGERDDYQFVTSFRTNEIQITQDIRGLYFTISVRSRQPPKYTFKAKNIKLQEQWREALKNNIPNNNLIEKNNEIRNSTRRARSLESGVHDYNSKFNRYSDSDDEWMVTGSPWSRRRAMKKRPSITKLSLTRQKSFSSSSDSEFIPSRKYTSSDVAHLTVWTLFHQFQSLYISARQGKNTQIFEDLNSSQIIEKEERYIQSLIESLGYFLDDTFAKPPREIMTHFRHIYEFHNEVFLPALKLKLSVSSAGLADCIQTYYEQITELYSKFFVDRVMLHEEMLDLEVPIPCIAPVNHLEHYFEVLLTQNRKPDNCNKVIPSLKILHDIITVTNNILLKLNVEGIPFSLDQCGPVLQCDRIRVKVVGRSRQQEYQAVLLPDVLLLLELKPPGYVFSESLRMDSVGVGPSNTDDYTFQLELRTTSTIRRSYSFRVHKPEMKQRWFTSITSILDEQVEQLKQQVKKRLGEAPSLDIHINENEKLLQTDL